MSSGSSDKIEEQMRNAGLPTSGPEPFKPKIVRSRSGERIIDKKRVTKGPMKGKKGYVDVQGRIWVRDWTHAHVPDHWDVQINDGEEYLRVDDNGNVV